MIRFLVSIAVIGFIGILVYWGMQPDALSPRETIDAGISQVKASTDMSPEEEGVLRVQLALTDVQIRTGKLPLTLEELVPKYFDEVPKDPATGQPYEYSRQGNVPRVGSQATQLAMAQHKEAKEGAQAGQSDLQAGFGGDFVNPNTFQVPDFTYNPEGKRDPFLPFDMTPRVERDGTLTALERYSLGQLRLTAVILSHTGERKGIVEDEQGRGYTVQAGTKIGNAGGVVAEVTTDSLKVVESNFDFTGKEVRRVVEIKIQDTTEAKKGKGGQGSRSRR